MFCENTQFTTPQSSKFVEFPTLPPSSLLDTHPLQLGWERESIYFKLRGKTLLQTLNIYCWIFHKENLITVFYEMQQHHNWWNFFLIKIIVPTYITFNFIGWRHYPKCFKISVPHCGVATVTFDLIQNIITTGGLWFFPWKRDKPLVVIRHFEGSHFSGYWKQKIKEIKVIMHVISNSGVFFSARFYWLKRKIYKDKNLSTMCCIHIFNM